MTAQRTALPNNRLFRRLLGMTLLLAGMWGTVAAQAPTPRPQPKVAPRSEKIAPKFEALAETKLLMEGLALANYRGLETLLKTRPNDATTWSFARGQALLIAETGNLLLLRPPRNQGQDVWFRRAMELRTAAAELARTAGGRDFPASQAALLEVANACNRCHKSFRVNFRAGPAERVPAPRTKSVGAVHATAS